MVTTDIPFNDIVHLSIDLSIYLSIYLGFFLKTGYGQQVAQTRVGFNGRRVCTVYTEIPLGKAPFIEKCGVGSETLQNKKRDSVVGGVTSHEIC